MFFYAVPEDVQPLTGFGNFMTADAQRLSLENQSPKNISHSSDDEDENSSRILDGIN